VHCSICRGPATILARTATTVWLGCHRCHRTWTADPRDCASAPSSAEDSLHRRLSMGPACLLAVALAAVAFGMRLLLRPVLGNASPFLLFTPVVGIAALYGGLIPGLFATVLSTALGSHFVLKVTGEPVIERWDRVILFALVGTVITISSALLRRSREELADSLWREQKAHAVAQAADKTKDDFLAMISHELQTPISVILGWLSMARGGALAPENTARALDVIERNARMLSRLVDDILDRSRIATGTLRLDPQVISLVTVMHASIDQVRGKIEAAGLELQTSLAAGNLPIVGDSIRLQQVFTNLLTNAVKFTPRGGSIAVSLTATGSDATVTVTDTGSGINPETLPFVFEPYRQGAETLGQSALGLGLGLSIARYLVERHAGTISCTSEGPGCGASFIVRLPLAVAAHATAPLPNRPAVAKNASPTSHPKSAAPLLH
jgi:signal transduction histidine kinase